MKRRNRTKTLICSLLTFAVLSCLMSQVAFAAAADPAPETSDEAARTPKLEDFAGEYICTGLAFDDNIVPLGEDESYTLKIEGDEAVITGMEELGTDPKELVFEDGEMTWTPPEEEEPVFILALEEDGIVTLTFAMIPEAPVFRFAPDTEPDK